MFLLTKKSFRRWIVEDDGDKLQMEPIMGAGISLPNLPSEGYVNPTTTSELWWPRDLSKLQIRPMLNVLFRNGMLSYVSAGLDVRVPCKKIDEDGDAISSWRNYGLNSQPIARQWTTLDIAMEKIFHVEGFIMQKNDQYNSDDNNEEEQQYYYETLFPSLTVQNCMQKVATFMAELDTLSPLSEGFHIASFPIMDTWTDLPKTLKEKEGSDTNDETTAEEDDETIYKIVCLATSEPFANKLLDMDEDILTMSSTSVLEVDVSRTAPGGESPYLAEPYKSLYLNS